MGMALLQAEMAAADTPAILEAQAPHTDTVDNSRDTKAAGNLEEEAEEEEAAEVGRRRNAPPTGARDNSGTGTHPENSRAVAQASFSSCRATSK